MAGEQRFGNSSLLVARDRDDVQWLASLLEYQKHNQELIVGQEHLQALSKCTSRLRGEVKLTPRPEANGALAAWLESLFGAPPSPSERPVRLRLKLRANGIAEGSSSGAQSSSGAARLFLVGLRCAMSLEVHNLEELPSCVGSPSYSDDGCGFSVSLVGQLGSLVTRTAPLAAGPELQELKLVRCFKGRECVLDLSCAPVLFWKIHLLDTMHCTLLLPPGSFLVELTLTLALRDGNIPAFLEQTFPGLQRSRTHWLKSLSLKCKDWRDAEQEEEETRRIKFESLWPLPFLEKLSLRWLAPEESRRAEQGLRAELESCEALLKGQAGEVLELILSYARPPTQTRVLSAESLHGLLGANLQESSVLSSVALARFGVEADLLGLLGLLWAAQASEGPRSGRGPRALELVSCELRGGGGGEALRGLLPFLETLSLQGLSGFSPEELAAVLFAANGKGGSEAAHAGCLANLDLRGTRLPPRPLLRAQDFPALRRLRVPSLSVLSEESKYAKLQELCVETPCDASALARLLPVLGELRSLQVTVLRAPPGCWELIWQSCPDLRRWEVRDSPKGMSWELISWLERRVSMRPLHEPSLFLDLRGSKLVTSSGLLKKLLSNKNLTCLFDLP